MVPEPCFFKAGNGGGVVLLTGFGPFPGVDRNASAELASELARRGSRRHEHLRFVAEVLPVNWRSAPVRLSDILHLHRPAVAIHFGVSARATGFVIETHAYNATKDVPDESGQIADAACLVTGGPSTPFGNDSSARDCAGAADGWISGGVVVGSWAIPV